MNNNESKDYLLLDKIKDINFTPIFILGLHRSGTSILYKMLGETGKINILTAYHILKYDNLIYNHINNLEEKVKEELNKELKIKGITTRKTDNIAVNSDYAHEYMYIFTKKNLPLKITNKNKLLFDQICRKLKFISKNNNAIILKNPHDLSNFLYIKKLYPNAKFIFIHRNPIDVISSLTRLWKTYLEEKSAYYDIFIKSYSKIFQNPLLLSLLRLYYNSKIPMGIFQNIFSCRKNLNYFLKNIDKLTKDSYISIKYEDLCRNPNNTMSQVLKFLEVKTNIDFSKQIKPRNLKIEPKVLFLKKYIFKKTKSYFIQFNYKI